ncbi:MAG TPA: MoxR family ATPase [Chloroflexota bacterium]|jgi:MoxR-like ATPase|nr:MoxR family ATPase [Chloroflexota bacterium]
MRDPFRLGRTVQDEKSQPVHVRGHGAGALADPVVEAQSLAVRVEAEIAKQLYGQTDLVRNVVIALLAGGHCLVEGTPGLGKTLLVRTLGQALGLRFSRIQFTPDLMPTDIIGTNVFSQAADGTKALRFEHGPIFAGVVLADEINRATPKTQSALLEAMEEGQVTVGKTTQRLPEPFFVLATQNPLEMEGTYPLPEVQLDRFFFKIVVGYPSADELRQIIRATTTRESVPVEHIASGDQLLLARAVVRELPIASYVRDYASRVVLATQPSREAPKVVRQFVSYGASPRGAQNLVLAAKARALLDRRYNVSFADIRAVAHPALRHRIKRNLTGEVAGVSTDELTEAVLEHVIEE